MDIYWLGESSFKLKGKQALVLVNPNGVSVDDLSFSGPGEYESKGVMIEGFSDKENTIYQITIDGLQVVHLGSPEKGGLDKEKLEGIDQTDILLTPLSSPVAELEPKVIVPYILDGEGLEKLVKELGAEGVGAVPKLSITKDRLPEEPMVVLLSHA